MQGILEKILALRAELETVLKPGRERSLAITNLEQCGHWVGAAYAADNRLASLLEQAVFRSPSIYFCTCGYECSLSAALSLVPEATKAPATIPCSNCGGVAVRRSAT